MNRAKITLEQIADIENCKRAILNASKKKRRRKSVAWYVEHLDEAAERLQEFLLDPDAEFHDGERGITYEGTKGKKRELDKPQFFPDHCAHWAVMQIVGEVLMKSYYEYSCASIKGRGTHYAKRAVERMLKDEKGTKYCLQVDVKSYYASIDKEKLVEMLERKIKDKRIIAILAKIIYAFKGAGLPIGFYTSAPLANFYLTPNDRYVKETLHITHSVRYMDDMVMYCGNKRELHEDRKKMAEFLNVKLGLRLKYNWQVYKMPYLKDKKERPKRSREHRATDFVGFKFFRYKTTIRKTIFLRLLRNIRSLQKGHYTPKNCQAFMSYNGYLKHTDSENVRRNHINGKINLSKIKEIIRNESRKYYTGGKLAAAV
ncbi:RNA-directed DNA polymerase [Anaerocaecibacter muris]|uniref:RNA-directed DNA polymerase n=1 Tax=Anaerocaecibacter muris TaxID=2941513 RepID=UPI00203C9C24|nr:RNA-directed DNA polymerase [Anaerocaecibacter muris]